jgi:hypothetical protein
MAKRKTTTKVADSDFLYEANMIPPENWSKRSRERLTANEPSL